MTFLAPWALVAGLAASAGVVLLHLVSRQRPAAYLLPTTRFVPDRRTLVSRLAARPRDLLLLALRVLLLVSAGAAFARPVLDTRRVPLARIVVLDRSAAVGDRAGALARARSLLSAEIPSTLVTFDSVAMVARDAAAALDSLARDTARAGMRGSITVALVAARRAAPALAGAADSVELVLVSPISSRELDAATDPVRARWPGRVTLVPLPLAAAPAPWRLDRTIGIDDPLGPALADVPAGGSGRGAVRLRRASLDSRDSAFARAGGAVVQWDTAGAVAAAPAALAVGDDVVVATLARGSAPERGRVVARWSDGAPAAVEEPLGAGCIRRVAVGVLPAGDLALRPSFRRAARGLMSPCAGGSVEVRADDPAIARLAGGGALATSEGLRGSDGRASPIVPWLLGLALACALGELALRARREPEAA